MPVTAPAQSSADGDDRFELAIVRRDGALIPFAAFDSGRWLRAWPDANEAGQNTYDAIGRVPSIWRTRRVPVPDRWRVWLFGGAGPIDARVTALTSVPAHCITQVALATTVPKQEVPPNVAPVRLFGLAVHGIALVGGIGKVAEQSDTWRQAAAAVLPQVDRLERAQAVREPSVPSIAESPPPRPRLTSLYRPDVPGPSALYFIAHKEYRAPRHPGDPSCPGRTVVTGWLLPARSGGLRMVATKVGLATCDEKNVATLEPLGRIANADRDFWIARELYYEGEAYVVFSIGPGAVTRAIAVYGGGC